MLLANGYWLFKYVPAARAVKRYANGFVITTCPVCAGALQLDEKVTTRLGIPVASRKVRCNKCASLIEETTLNAWRWEVDESFNPEMKWLYSGEVLTDDDLKQIAFGKHTQNAVRKISERDERRRREEREQLERERKATRAATLALIRSGDMNALVAMEERLIEVPPKVMTARGAAIYTRLELGKDEVCILVMQPVSLGESRTKDGRPFVSTVDTAGELVVTNKRYAFVGPSKTMQQKLSVIESMEHQKETLAVRRSTKKTPDYFMGVDAELVEAVLNGIRAK